MCEQVRAGDPLLSECGSRDSCPSLSVAAGTAVSVCVAAGTAVSVCGSRDSCLSLSLAAGTVV